MEENIINVDLNIFISDEIKKQISDLKEELASAKLKIRSLSDENSKQKKDVDSANKIMTETNNGRKLLLHIKDNFDKIEATPKDEDNYGKLKKENQFLFIEKMLLNLFGIKIEAKGWYNGTSLGTNLAINYYSNKTPVSELLNIFGCDETTISTVRDLVMPWDYSKSEVMAFVKNPESNTNGYMFGITEYWTEYGAKKRNMPYDLIMKNPFILEEDVFSELIKTITSKRNSNYPYLFALSKYNADITPNQIELLGSTIPSLCNKDLPDVIKQFIEIHLKDFNDYTLEFLITKVNSTNQFSTLHWNKFPNKYQGRFLMEKNINEIIQLLSHYSCTWLKEDKEAFLAEYLKNKMIK